MASICPCWPGLMIPDGSVPCCARRTWHGILRPASEGPLPGRPHKQTFAELQALREEWIAKDYESHYVLARDLGEEYTLQEIDEVIAEGLDDIERGDTIDGDETIRQLRAYTAERRRQRA